MNTCYKCGQYTRCRKIGFRWYHYIIYFWWITWDTDFSSSWICKKCDEYDQIIERRRLMREEEAHKEFLETEKKKNEVWVKKRDKLLNEVGK